MAEYKLLTKDVGVEGIQTLPGGAATRRCAPR